MYTCFKKTPYPTDAFGKGFVKCQSQDYKFFQMSSHYIQD